MPTLAEGLLAAVCVLPGLAVLAVAVVVGRRDVREWRALDRDDPEPYPYPDPSSAPHPDDDRPGPR